MTTQIVVHLLPQEIDWFEWQSRQFKIGSQNIDNSIVIDVTLNLNLVDWENSSIPKDFFINKFNQIKLLWDWADTIFTVSDNGECLGTNDKKRDSIRSTLADNLLWLDSDIIFRPELLSYLTSISNMIPEEYYVITPQIGKLWDSSWDVLVNNNYVNESPCIPYDKDPFSIVYKDYDDIFVDKINTFKFGAGWGNLISTNLVKLIDIPDSLGSYGVEDTYTMYCSEILKNKGFNIQQYVVNNILVAENLKYRSNPYEEFIALIDRKSEFRKIAEDNLQLEIQKFINRIQ